MKLTSIRNTIEIIDNEQEVESILKIRVNHIDKYPPLGLPDMCYLVKALQNKSVLSVHSEPPQLTGMYHYIYGLSTQTPANISTYISQLLQNQETEQKWFKSSECRISRVYFCIFDVFTRVDIRMEVNIPGQMKLFAYTSENNILVVNDKLWMRGYVSSVLRSMQPAKFYQGKIF